LKEKIEIRNILIYDEVFLLFHNKYNNLTRQQGMKLDEQIKMVSELENVVGKDVNEFVKKVCDDIYDMLNRVLNVNEYDELKKRIKKQDLKIYFILTKRLALTTIHTAQAIWILQ
jgi:hypothetical protein